MSIMLRPTRRDEEFTCPLCDHPMGYHWDHLLHFPKLVISMRCDHSIVGSTQFPDPDEAVLCRCKYYMDCIEEESDEVDHPVTRMSTQLYWSTHTKRS